uniref:Uncharacterized protein n=1 Tax=viral metagenome TaxID=1070528 RepID=A0A6M3LMF7_9ZZZZ
MTYDELIERHNIKPYLGILPGLGWLEENEHKYDGWRPSVEVSGPGFRHRMSINPNQAKVVSKVMKINKRGKR